MEPGDTFDCDQLLGFIIQVNNEKEGGGVLKDLRPVGIFCDFKGLLPYLTLLMELGTESRH